MTEEVFLSRWYIALGVAGVIVLVAAVLLLAIVWEAKRIERGARRALTSVNTIQEQTQVLWQLADVNEAAAQLNQVAGHILDHLRHLAGALHEADQRRGRAG